MSVDDHAIEHALARGASQQIGQYRLDLTTGSWWWSSETYRVHGFEPGEVVPTTELVLAHKHPDDRERVRRILDEARATGEPFSSVHRIMDAHGKERYLVIVGQGRRDPDTGEVVELLGYFVDITATVAAGGEERAHRDIAAAAAGRGPIEQAKGVLVTAYGICPEEAFGLLKRASNDKNVRLRDLARVVVDEAMRSGADCAERVDALLR
ncbi:PAS and ANTAR domain-containing protein [Cellulosimicrobium cellulans]|uniref:PAS and ANTAR domain-containing protein n=1 Tax=Cellulosimicrobium cellulans TaxID=1710 RepID=UPI001962CD70|nr:PAS and ANTAR domain-containing protein [Cellulosimicrobium cellulans]MBN0039540.1 PAS and ANTAR domain-containing protein [Cellulosimicrobium cellulans]